MLGGVGDFLGDDVDGAIIFLGLGSAYCDLITCAERDTVLLPVVGRASRDKDAGAVCFEFDLKTWAVIVCLDVDDVSLDRDHSVDIVAGFEVQGFVTVLIDSPKGEGLKRL